MKAQQTLSFGYIVLSAYSTRYRFATRLNFTSGLTWYAPGLMKEYNFHWFITNTANNKLHLCFKHDFWFLLWKKLRMTDLGRRLLFNYALIISTYLTMNISTFSHIFFLAIKYGGPQNLPMKSWCIYWHTIMICSWSGYSNSQHIKGFAISMAP